MLTSLYARTAAYLEMVLAVVINHLRPRRSATLAARGVTFIEYALLAAIAVVIAVIFRTQLKAIFTTVFGRISGSVNED